MEPIHTHLPLNPIPPFHRQQHVSFRYDSFFFVAQNELMVYYRTLGAESLHFDL